MLFNGAKMVNFKKICDLGVGPSVDSAPFSSTVTTYLSLTSQQEPSGTYLLRGAVPIRRQSSVASWDYVNLNSLEN
ncbi:hypothetical protein NQ317_019515 [Molorchus minor]|uniref:Uncharacterized protein n=1 Tax=Molorchus minor TaxID=1323400 RepID=A0ABQ9JXN6_9CUCU|nr:hypothetical protein NQ317_019515 [Molorchus minor]